MLVGIFVQMIAITFYTILGVEFLWRVHKQRPARPHAYLSMDLNLSRASKGGPVMSKKVKWMIIGLSVSTVFIFVR